jgi:hypothetical protein
VTSLAHTESTRASHLRAHLGSYLVGAGATAAIIAGVVVAFLSMATFVAFSGLPFGGSNADSGAAYLTPAVDTAPRSAAVALGAARAAVAGDPARRLHARDAGSAGASLGAVRDARGGGPSRGGSSAGGPTGGPTGGGPGGGAPAGGGPTATPPTGGPTVTPSVPDLPPASPLTDLPSVPVPSPSAGPITGAVDRVGDVAGTDLSGTTGSATSAVDGAATGLLNRAGGEVGQPNLGDQAGTAVSGVTGSL